ncbi:RTA1 like protein-domain-containing protein [Pyrenochaeta sp. MPI-SDFR-AT-0127]|nr:RTA1 like protein-domain-containing protein [Pyrenochaeta sp. MPI-SDFR-AT-0127]
MAEEAPVKHELWAYTPSRVGGVIGAIVFLALSLFHMFRLFKNRVWFCMPLVLGGLFEAVGYGARAVAHGDTTSKMPYIAQSVLILIAPILFAASIYMILGRLITRTNTGFLSIVRPTRVTKLFVAGDLLCFFIQSGGAGMLVQAKSKEDVKRGESIILGGLIVQILTFGFFVVVAGVWQCRLGSYQKNAPGATAANEINWRRYIKLLYAASACITVRNSCRVVEYAMGKVGLVGPSTATVH